jgi:predicted MFS family arabinose efflux permease
MNGTSMRQPLITRQVGWFLLFALLANSCLSLLFAVLPLFASDTTGNEVIAGLTTGTMMLVTVLVELATPRLMSAIGYRRSMELGAVLLGLPALLLIPFAETWAILLVAAIRGAGLAITVVATTALAAHLFPPERRGEGLGIFGAVISLPAVALLPLGLWLAETIGFESTFLIAGALTVVALAISRTLPTLHPGATPAHGVMTELREPGILQPTVIFGLSTFAVGILITYLALAVPEDRRHIAAIGLFVQAVCTAFGRYGSGRLGDRLGAGSLLAPSMLLCAVGMTLIVATGSTISILAGMAVFGLGLGGAQNTSLTMMFERAASDRYAQVSVIWNLAYDAGQPA